MAVSTRPFSRQRDYSRLIIALAVLAGFMAVAPIAAAVLGLGGATTGARTAFASAPSGEYAVLGRNDGQADVISVAWASNPGAVTEIARVPHLEGFTSSGAVSPDGKSVALVSVDGGSRVRPTASLNVVNLESGRVVRAAANVVPGQQPVWTPDGKALVVTRMPGGNDTQGAIQLLRAGADGNGETILREYGSALGVYPVGFDAGGQLVTVVIDGAGSSLVRGDGAPVNLSAGLTRDWKLSPDGAQLAFVEVRTSAGVEYVARTVQMESAGVAAQSLSASVSALGVAWDPKSGTATFGIEPGQAAPGVMAQALTADETGFDVPLGYSASGEALVVTRWNGGSFEAPGKPVLELVTSAGRAQYESYTRFFGWSVR